MSTPTPDHYDPREYHALINHIRAQEVMAQAALDRAKQSVRCLSASVLRLKEQRLSLIELDA
jgi:hypothetical protein